MDLMMGDFLSGAILTWAMPIVLLLVIAAWWMVLLKRRSGEES
jgi:cytochrome c-type biogenesis protein CcmH/NrfF